MIGLFYHILIPCIDTVSFIAKTSTEMSRLLGLSFYVNSTLIKLGLWERKNEVIIKISLSRVMMMPGRLSWFVQKGMFRDILHFTACHAGKW